MSSQNAGPGLRTISWVAMLALMIRMRHSYMHALQPYAAGCHPGDDDAGTRGIVEKSLVVCPGTGGR